MSRTFYLVAIDDFDPRPPCGVYASRRAAEKAVEKLTGSKVRQTHFEIYPFVLNAPLSEKP